MNPVRSFTALAAGLCVALAAGAAPAPLSGVDTGAFDRTVAPQTDFYQHINGGWLAHTDIPADRAFWTPTYQLHDQARQQLREILEQPLEGNDSAERRKLATFYQSFMDEATIERLKLTPLAGAFARIDKLRTRGDIAAEFGRLDRTSAGSPIDYSIDVDVGDTTRYIVSLSQSGLGLPDRDYYLATTGKLAAIRAKYVTYVRQMLTLSGRPDAARRARAIVALETRIADAQWTKEANRDPVKTYNRMATQALAKLAPELDWPQYLAAIRVEGRISDLTVAQPSYLTQFGHIFAETPVATWREYLRWRVLNAAARYLPRAYVDTRFAFYGTALRDVPTIEPRWKRAVQATETAMGEALGREYVARHFPPAAKAKITALVGNVLSAYRQSIDGLDWMGADTKREAQAKLAAINVKVGYPDRWRDYSRLVVKGDDLYGNVTRGEEFATERELAKLGQPIDRDEWVMTPQTVNAYYRPDLNEIVFLAALLQPPVFQADADDAVNYGAIGAMIGHEISHGFDDQGAQYDGKGNLRDWWTPEDHARFKAKTSALAAQYSAYEVAPGLHANGELTLGENIADNSGLEIAYKAYLLSLGGGSPPVIDGLTGAQRFYAGFAAIWREKMRESEVIRLLKSDPHSMGRLRTLGTLSNQDAFFEAWGVKPGDGMYVPPERRTHIW